MIYNLWMLATAAALLLLSPIAGPAHADADAMIRGFEGPVRIRPFGEKKYVAAQADFPLAYRDQIKTGPKGLVQVEFPNGTVVLVKENSFFMIGGGPKGNWVSFRAGEFLIGLKRALDRGQSFLVRTPSAVAAVRGTLFWGLSDAKKNSSWASFGHKVAVTAQGKTVVLAPGQTVQVAYGSPPGTIQPSKVPKSYLRSFAVKDELLGLDKLADPSLP